MVGSWCGSLRVGGEVEQVGDGVGVEQLATAVANCISSPASAVPGGLPRRRSICSQMALVDLAGTSAAAGAILRRRAALTESPPR